MNKSCGRRHHNGKEADEMEVRQRQAKDAKKDGKDGSEPKATTKCKNELRAREITFCLKSSKKVHG